jgi:hypothetical protein
VVVKMGVDEAGGDEVVGVGVVLVVEGGVDVEGGGEEEELNVEELEGGGVNEEELVVTGVGLLLAIELDIGGLEELEGGGDGVDAEVGAGPVSVLEVELEAIVNCLLKTSFLGCLRAMVSERNIIISSWVCSQHIYLGVEEAHHTSGLGLDQGIAAATRIGVLGCLGGNCRIVVVSCFGKSVGRAPGAGFIGAQLLRTALGPESTSRSES